MSATIELRGYRVDYHYEDGDDPGWFATYYNPSGDYILDSQKVGHEDMPTRRNAEKKARSVIMRTLRDIVPPDAKPKVRTAKATLDRLKPSSAQKRPTIKKALRELFDWATKGDRTGNPYFKPAVANALLALGGSRYDLPAKRPTVKGAGILYDLAKWSTGSNREGNPYMVPAVKAAYTHLGDRARDEADAKLVLSKPKALEEVRVMAYRDPVVDEDAVYELDLYMESTSELYRQKKAILDMLAKKVRAGKYDQSLAWKAWAPWVESGVKLYTKEMGLPSDSISRSTVNKATRDALAKKFAEHYDEGALRNEYGGMPLAKPAKPAKPARSKASSASKFGKLPAGIRVVWLKPNQAWSVMWNDSVLRVLTTDAEVRDYLRELHGPRTAKPARSRRLASGEWTHHKPAQLSSFQAPAVSSKYAAYAAQEAHRLGGRSSLGLVPLVPGGLPASSGSRATAYDTAVDAAYAAQEAHRLGGRTPITAPASKTIQASSGYAYEWDGTGRSWQRSADDAWDTVLIDAGPAKELGVRLIDGARVVVFERDGKVYAQTSVGLGRG